MKGEWIIPACGVWMLLYVITGIIKEVMILCAPVSEKEQGGEI